MLKNYSLIAFSIALLISAAAFGQCTPDENMTGLFKPSQQEGLPDGDITIPYEAVIYIKAPADTSYLTLSADIDSLVLTNVAGLPTGFSYSCNPPSCGIPGGEAGCIVVSGISNDNADAKTWDIEAEFMFHITSGLAGAVQLPYTIDFYSIKLDSVAVGIKEFDNDLYKFFIEPNPVSETSVLKFDLPEAGNYSLNVYSLLGAEVANIQSMGKKGSSTFALGEFAHNPGVYFISLKQGDYSRSMRFIVH